MGLLKRGAAFAGIGLLASALALAAPKKEEPAIWTIQKPNGTTITLFGSSVRNSRNSGTSPNTSANRLPFSRRTRAMPSPICPSPITATRVMGRPLPLASGCKG